MSIIMNESEWVEEVLSKKTLGDRPSSTLLTIAKYYYNDGYSPKQVEEKLELFLLQCDPNISLVKWSDAIDYAVKKGQVYTLRNIDLIPVRDKEMKTITSLKGVQQQRLAFTLLCLSRYLDMANEKNNHWIGVRDTDIMKMANISTSIKRQSAMYASLEELGLIQFSKLVDNTNVRVLFQDDTSDVVLEVTDMRNLGYQFMHYMGGDFFICENCGITEKVRSPKKGRPQKYCTSCAVEIKTIQSVNAVMQRRFDVS